MNDNGADIVRMSFEGGNLLGGVVVVDAKLEIVRTAYYPVLAGNETACSYRDVGEFESFNDGLPQCKQEPT